MSDAQVRDIVDAMQEKRVPSGCYLIREGEDRVTTFYFSISVSGDTGSYLYVAAEGQFEVIKDGKILGNLGVGKVSKMVNHKPFTFP